MTQMTVDQRRDLVRGLIAEERWREAEADCQALWQAFGETQNLWDCWQYAYCLYKLGKLTAAEQLCAQAHQMTLEGSFEPKAVSYIRFLYARVLNDRYFKSIKKALDAELAQFLLDTANKMGELVAHDEGTPLEFCTFRALAYANKSLQKYPAQVVLDMLARLDPDKLSEKIATVAVGRANVEIQSNQEAYFAHKTKALLRLERYADCLECCNVAFDTIKDFHFGNEYWIADRMVSCIAFLGDLDSAIKKSELLAAQKPNWFLLYSLARLYLKADQPKKALTTMLRAAHTPEPMDAKVGLLVDIGDLMAQFKRPELAQRHYLASKQIREKNDWPIPFALKRKLKSDFPVDLNQLRQDWLTQIHALLGTIEGTIASVLPSGKSGFIRCEAGSFYFNARSIQSRPAKPCPGARVTFCLIDSFDHKNQRPTKEAGYIVLT